MSACLCACLVTKSKRHGSAVLPESCRCALRSPRLFQVCLARVSWRGRRAEREAGERKQEGKKGAVKKKTQHFVPKVPTCACSLRCAPRGCGHPEPPPAGGPLHPLGGDGCLQGGVRSKALGLHISMSLFGEGIVFLVCFFRVFNPRIICTKPFVKRRCLLCTCESTKSEVAFPAAPSPIRAALQDPKPFPWTDFFSIFPLAPRRACCQPHLLSAVCEEPRTSDGEKTQPPPPLADCSLAVFLSGMLQGFSLGVFSHKYNLGISETPRRSAGCR